jgi:hypothetical protein
VTVGAPLSARMELKPQSAVPSCGKPIRVFSGLFFVSRPCPASRPLLAPDPQVPCSTVCHVTSPSRNSVLLAFYTVFAGYRQLLWLLFARGVLSGYVWATILDRVGNGCRWFRGLPIKFIWINIPDGELNARNLDCQVDNLSQGQYRCLLSYVLVAPPNAECLASCGPQPKMWSLCGPCLCSVEEFWSVSQPMTYVCAILKEAVGKSHSPLYISPTDSAPTEPMTEPGVHDLQPHMHIMHVLADQKC